MLNKDPYLGVRVQKVLAEGWLQVLWAVLKSICSLCLHGECGVLRQPLRAMSPRPGASYIARAGTDLTGVWCHRDQSPSQAWPCSKKQALDLSFQKQIPL